MKLFFTRILRIIKVVRIFDLISDDIPNFHTLVEDSSVTKLKFIITLIKIKSVSSIIIMIVYNSCKNVLNYH